MDDLSAQRRNKDNFKEERERDRVRQSLIRFCSVDLKLKIEEYPVSSVGKSIRAQKAIVEHVVTGSRLKRNVLFLKSIEKVDSQKKGCPLWSKFIPIMVEGLIVGHGGYCLNYGQLGSWLIEKWKIEKFGYCWLIYAILLDYDALLRINYPFLEKRYHFFRQKCQNFRRYHFLGIKRQFVFFCQNRWET